MSTILLESLAAWWPEVVLSLGALLVVLAGVWSKRSGPALAVTWAALLASAIALWQAPVPPATATFFGLIICDPFSLAFRWLALGVTAIVILLVMGSSEVSERVRGEYLGLLLLVAVGLMLMAEANHLLMAYVAMELVSLSGYVLVGLLDDSRSAEASLKYLLFGALASGVMLFGMSLLFGLTGELAFPELLRATSSLAGPQAAALLVAVMLMLAGLAFKISMVPFHLWTPDAYEGAPVAVTALLSVGPKAAGLALLWRLMAALLPAWTTVAPLLAVLTVMTMTLGNLVSLVQTNIKRLLAYSTIAQVGYLLIGFVVNTKLGLEALLLYLVAYLFMNLGAFACVAAVVNETGSEALEAFRGLSKRAPVLALLCTLFLLSLAGIPPLLGFFGKFLLFGSALQAGQAELAVAGVLNSAIALYYYVNIIRLMYLVAPERAGALTAPRPLRVALVICGVATLFLGLFPSTLLSLVEHAASLNLL
ncbi:MAG: NADH-quinone oxidoreductase subunit N [Candidatus Omnitrophica bacterium]|nr:NADH-quinone oxidoreductase subunit N [Candidatus Omnitrophota bacterium]